MFQGCECLSLGHFLRTWPPDMRSKNYLTVFSCYSVPQFLFDLKCNQFMCAYSMTSTFTRITIIHDKSQRINVPLLTRVRFKRVSSWVETPYFVFEIKHFLICRRLVHAHRIMLLIYLL